MSNTNTIQAGERTQDWQFLAAIPGGYIEVDCNSGKQRRRKSKTPAQRHAEWRRYGIGGCIQKKSKLTGLQFNAAMVAYYAKAEGSAS